MAAPAFATPLPQSPRSDILEWRFPRPYHQYVLTGRSRAAWHTSFVVPQLDLLLDAGLCVNKLRPRHVFLTHGHSDHTLLAPAFVRRDDPPDVFCPAEMQRVFDRFIHAHTLLNLGGGGGEDVADEELPSSGTPSDDGEDDRPPPKSSAAGGRLLDTHATHVTHGLRPGDEVPLRRLRGDDRVTARAFACDHSVPCLGYIFSKTTRGLRPEFAGLTGRQLQALRSTPGGGVEITQARSRPVFAFLGDTTAATLAAAPAWLEAGIPVVVTECSFLHEEHRAVAARTRHTLWADLEPVVRRWPRTTFVLMHFSLRYTDEEVRRFFKGLKDPPPNLVIWVDGQDEPKK